ncbi:MAG: enoyl-CoA hydratase/isomerase family protein [Sphingobacteriaceae bacterium]
MTYINIVTELRNRILFVTISRENKRNALNNHTLAELHNCIADTSSNVEIGGIIITGAGLKSFVAGADITELENLTVEQGHALATRGQNEVFDLIANSSKPVIAAINGFALGGGLELALACHIRIASVNAQIGLPEVTLGLIPGYGGTQRLTQLIGSAKALELILTADRISAGEAFEIGLVNHVVLQDQLLNKAEHIMQKILSRAPLAVAAAIKAINASSRTNINGFEVEIQEFSKCFSTFDFKEGIAAFNEKRKPVFTGI